VTGTLAEESTPFQLPSAPDFPLIGEGEAVPVPEVNGLDQRSLTSDGREYRLVFTEEVARFKNSFGFYTIDESGRFENVEVLYPDVNSTTFDPNRPLVNDGQGPLTPGETISLGVIPAGTRFGFFAIQKGFTSNPADALTLGEGERFELRNSSGQPARLSDEGGLTLVKVAANGQVTTIKGLVFMTADATQNTPNVNPLNPDDSGHVISGFVAGSGGIIFGMEDQFDTGTVNRSSNDRDFNDLIFTLQFGNKLEEVLFLPDQEGQLNPRISDPDSQSMSAASAAITSGAKPGDTLFLAGLSDSDGDGVIDGTNITVTRISPIELQFSGVDSIDNYQLVLNGVRYDNFTDPSLGTREVSLTVTDDQGAVSEPFVVPIHIEDLVIAGDNNPNVLTGTEGDDAISGRGGHDNLSGLGGQDLIDGGGGDDQIFGGAGDDILFGGTGGDVLTGGPGADRFVHSSLIFGVDVIPDFNQPQGDRLDLTQLFADPGNVIPDPLQYKPGESNDAQYFKLIEVNADGLPGKETIQVQVDLDGPGRAFDFQAIANLTEPTGVTTSTPIQDIVVTQPQQGSDGATS
jgi:Ca2+-binding RTX toxin-like protein